MYLKCTKLYTGPVLEDQYFHVYANDSLNLGLSSRDWYHGDMTQDEAEEMLTASGNDCFLIRHDQQMLVLSLSHCEKFYHVKIKHSPGGYELENGTAECPFTGLDDLINYYHKNALSSVIDTKLDQICDSIYASVLPMNFGKYTVY